MEKKRYKLLKYLIFLLFYLGIFILLLPYLKGKLIEYKILIQPTVYQKTSYKTQKGNFQYDQIAPPTVKDVTEAYFKKAPEGVTGELIIPDISVDVSVFRGADNEMLLRGAGMMFSDRKIKTDNIVLLGHHLRNDTLLFGPLLQAKKGMMSYLKFQNKIYQYRIMEKQIVSDKELSVLDNQKGLMLTLITCDTANYTNQRVVITAEPMSEAAKKDQSKSVAYKKVIKHFESENNQEKSHFIAAIKVFYPVFILLLLLFIVSVMIDRKLFR